MIYKRPKWNCDQWDRNVFYLRHQLNAFVQNISSFVKIICGFVVFSYILLFFNSDQSDFSQILVVIPSNLKPPTFWFWTLITFSFVEFHFWHIVIDFVILNLYGKLIEPIWGSPENWKFFFVVNTSVAIASTMYFWTLFIITQNTDYLFFVQIHGLTGYIAAILVAIKQIMPDSILVRSPYLIISNQNVPLTSLVVLTTLCVLGFCSFTYLLMFYTGLLSSWFYLRFYQMHQNGVQGDTADNFSFSSFFPYAFQPSVDVFSTIIYQLAVRMKLCKKMIRKVDNSNPSGITIMNNTSNDAERRKQIAVKALNERLSEISKQQRTEKRLSTSSYMSTDSVNDSNSTY